MAAAARSTAKPCLDMPVFLAVSGVGPALAEAIIKDREQNGPFESAEALMRVKGIGQHIIELNKTNILVSSPPAAKR